MTLSENEHIKKIIEGDHELYSVIVRQYQNMVFGICMGFCHNSHDAADLSQDIFIRAYENLEYFAGKSKFSTWLYRIAINAALNFKRRRKREVFFSSLMGSTDSGMKSQPTEPIDAVNHITPELQIITSQERQAINDAIDRLPSKQRTAFVLSKYEELPQREIAAIMEISEGAVEQLLMRAKANLQKYLAPFYKRNYQ